MAALEKLLIKAYATPDFSGQPTGEFAAFVNPAEITLSFEREFDSAQGSGTTGSRMEFKKCKAGDLSLTFFIDGTGANGLSGDGSPVDVQAQVELFETVTGYNGDIHRPNYLKITWGKLQVKRCVLKGASITYKLFKPDGVPLRAVITATFIDTSDDATRVALAQDQSADLTHVRLVKAGDTLPGMCFKIYGDPRYYVQVARANGLDDFRNLVPGKMVFFPPIKK